MSTAQTSSDQRLVLWGVSWRTYERLLRAFDERPGVRLTYDRGMLEIMTLSHGHEYSAYLLGRFVIVLTEELNLPLHAGKSTTLRRRKRQRGLEPDECYWIANEPLVRGKEEIDLRHDPPPDLGMEIDVSRSSLNRMGIYAAMRVPEVWRFDGHVLSFHVLGQDGKYAESGHSLTFPQLSPNDLLPFLNLRGQMDDNAIIRQFRAWVRQRFGGGQATP
jgi:Uma2 family endonuclease